MAWAGDLTISYALVRWSCNHHTTTPVQMVTVATLVVIVAAGIAGWTADRARGPRTEVERARISVHIYDAEGKLAEQPDGWEKGHFAAAHIIPKSTGSYFIIVNIEESPEERTHWALVYGFR